MVLLAQSGDTRAQVLKSYNNLKAAIVKSKNTKELKAFVEVGRKALEQLIVRGCRDHHRSLSLTSFQTHSLTHLMQVMFRC
jgi:hypothetical protein